MLLNQIARYITLIIIDITLKVANEKLTTDEIISARNKWIKRLPKDDQQDLRSSEWKLVEDRQAGILRCEG